MHSFFRIYKAFSFVRASLVSQLVKNAVLECRRPGFDPWVGKIPWRRERLPTPVFWPGEFPGLYSPWGHRVRHDWATSTFSLFLIIDCDLIYPFSHLWRPLSLLLTVDGHHTATQSRAFSLMFTALLLRLCNHAQRAGPGEYFLLYLGFT